MSLSGVKRDEIEAKIEAAVANGQDDLPKERDAQVYAAKIAARTLLESDGLFSGGPGDAFNISIYGHANPGHAPKRGYSNDTISVNVTRADAPPVGAPTEADNVAAEIRKEGA